MDFINEEEKGWLTDTVVPVKGKFRSELLKSDRHYVMDIARPSAYSLSRIENDFKKPIDKVLSDKRDENGKRILHTYSYDDE